MPTTFTACLGNFVELLQAKAAGVSDFLAGKLCASGLSDEALEQVLALTLGIRDTHSATMTLFREAGVSHVMALSGLHLTVFCLFLALFVYPVRRVMGPFWLRLAMMLLVVALVWGYVLVAGCPMSMVRAAAMFSVAIAGALFYWRMTLLQVWTLAVMLILTLSPRSLTDVGFQLSSMATLGIASFGALKSRWEDNVLWMWLRIGFWCQVFTLPLVAHYFGTFVPHAVFTSLFVSSYTTVVLMMCFVLILALLAGVTPLSSFLALSISGLLDFQTTLLRLITSVASPVSGLRFSWWCVFLYYASLASLYLYLYAGERERGRHVNASEEATVRPDPPQP